VLHPPACNEQKRRTSQRDGRIRRDYGIILAVNGDSGGLIGTPDARWHDNDLTCLPSLTLADFEPVNVASLIVTNDSGVTKK
jgi:hypothetical protein